MGTSAGAPAAAFGGRRRFYGWRVVGAAFAVLFVAYGLQFSFGVFVTAVTADAGWSRRQLLVPYGIYVAAYSALSSVAGFATDRFGPRRVVAVGGVFLGVGWAWFGLARSLWEVYVALGVVAGVGMSATWVPCNATVVRWFVRRRGLAVGAASAGGSVGNLVAPPVAAVLVEGVGWRAALVAMAAAGGAVLVACSRVVVRDPEALGLHPDGAAAPAPLAASDPGGLSLAEARRTATFWCLAGVFSLSWLVVFVPFAHLVAFAESLGYGTAGASLLLSAVGLGGVAGRLGAGPLSDRVGRRPALAGALALQVASFAGFAASRAPAALFVPAVAFGASYGGSVALFPALVADRFGRRSAGAIVGTLFAGAGSVAAVGPVVAAVLYDATGSYRLAFVLCAAANAAALALAFSLRPPRRRTPSSLAAALAPPQ